MQQLSGKHDKQLELTLLACCLVNPTALNEPWAAMPDEVFYLESHRELWRELQRQYQDAGWYDLSTVVAAFHERGKAEMMLNVIHPAIAEFEGAYHPTSAFAYQYAAQLKRLYVMREKGNALNRYHAVVANGDEDPNSARLELEAVVAALDAMIGGSEDVTDDELIELILHGRHSTGIPDLDKASGGLARPGLNILAAKPGVGKSALARTIIRHATNNGQRVFWYSQDQAQNQVFELEVARLKRISVEMVRKLGENELRQAIETVRNEVWRSLVILVDRPLKLAQLTANIKTAAPALVVVDYIQIIDTGHSDEYEAITATSKALKTLALQMRIPVLALAQFNRQYRAGQPPSLAQLRGSGQIEQDADVVWALDRDTTLATTEEQEAYLYILKNKVGPTGKVPLHWRGKWASYESAVRHP